MPSLEIVPEFPPSGGFTSAVKSSCSLLRQRANISIEPESIRRLLFSPAFLTSFRRVSKSHGLVFPLNFPSILSELNFLSIVCLLNFASGYRVPLHLQTGRGAWDNIRAFSFSLYLTSSTGEGDLLSARGMQNIGEQKVAELMGVNVHVERPHDEIPGVTVGELRGPIYDLVKLVSATLTETGQVLQENGYTDLGSFVLEALKDGEVSQRVNGTGAGLNTTLEKLVRAIPAFRDMAVVDGQPVYCFKKALLLIYAVTIRFGAGRSPTLPIPDISQTPIFTDNVIPSMLVHLGVVDLSNASHALSSIFPEANSAEKLNALLGEAPTKDASEVKLPPIEGPILIPDQAYILRAAAVDACELIVQYARSLDPTFLTSYQGKDLSWIKDIKVPDLNTWLWAGAKDRTDYRELERFVLRDTAFF
ncbi:hypothetical protein SERLA73DRAFT_179571 [Serpula lacrymans var. lacrymans S7.3]|uniref:Queuosine 5'-phosphate N-glycosylase/hydrolase n=2 Tax=Serpula lacrymans var. lacrymans TaxID=341189 RepID=F8PVG7_SERL3|nr:uncharacterized protein SERLADRAFT_464751 [Serpula lacrymans var. lacrymans S7.9]EGN99520.1 hypothetical protein SERLA73DRAFT_179571 [Serpula lacrymans var. lacrymans S7.3]EGO25096.1 hypothetical protein SERLADRAFT_464751 [Serpula lacrymans var. lacrymans S7.9]